MRKCGICMVGSWTVGLAAVAWGLAGVFEVPVEWSLPLRVVAGLVGLTGLGFLFYQPPLKPCPRCVKANQAG